MRRGRKVQIQGVTEADGVKFYRVTAPPAQFGWVQADAVFGKFRSGDEERLSRFVQAETGFDQIETAIEFLSFTPIHPTGHRFFYCLATCSKNCRPSFRKTLQTG